MSEPTREELQQGIGCVQFLEPDTAHDHLRGVYRLALEALDRRAQTTAWVIERNINGRLFYWNGRPSGEQQWSLNHEFAVRFTRESDAKAMLIWHCGDEGRTVEHMWVGCSIHQPKEGK